MVCKMPEGLKRGDRVRVILEGEVRNALTSIFDIGGPASANTICPSASHVVSIEVLPDPIRVGDTVIGLASGARYFVLAIHEDKVWCRKEDGIYFTLTPEIIKKVTP